MHFWILSFFHRCNFFVDLSSIFTRNIVWYGVKLPLDSISLGFATVKLTSFSAVCRAILPSIARYDARLLLSFILFSLLGSLSRTFTQLLSRMTAACYSFLLSATFLHLAERYHATISLYDIASSEAALLPSRPCSVHFSQSVAKHI